ncbi:MAG: type II secretion system protein GspJ [Planctomycetota bacterium]|jgi:general secretion pathway protein J
MYLKVKGFTLIEVMVASIIGAFVAFVAIGALKAVSVSAESIDNVIDVRAEVRFASEMIKKNLLNLYRDVDRKRMKLVGAVEEVEDRQTSLITFYVTNRAKARIGQPESDVYEVEYLLHRDEEKSTLMRRLWPNPSEDLEPGGILTRIAEGIDVFSVRFFDGDQWLGEWPEDMRNLPEMVEVVLAANRKNSNDFVVESFFVNFARATGQIDGLDSEAAKQ